MSRLLTAAVVSLWLSSGCGAAPVSSGGEHPGTAGSAVDDPSDPALDVDPQPCASDAECMVGTPRDCCTSFCPEDVVAWSRSAWAAYQDECAVEECAHPEALACRPEAAREWVAICRDGRCALQ